MKCEQRAIRLRRILTIDHKIGTFLTAPRVRPPFKLFESLKSLVEDGRVVIDLDTPSKNQDGQSAPKAKKLVATLIEQANEPLRVGASTKTVK